MQDTFLPRNPSWNSILHKEDLRSHIWSSMLFLSELLPLALPLNGVFTVCELVDVRSKRSSPWRRRQANSRWVCSTLWFLLVYVQCSRVFCYKLDPFPAFDEPMAKLRVYNDRPLSSTTLCFHSHDWLVFAPLILPWLPSSKYVSLCAIT